MLTAVSGVQVTPGNRVDLLHNGDEIFPAMLDAIDRAERSIDLLTYVYWAGEIGIEFAHRLAQRARNGVRVRVLLAARPRTHDDPGATLDVIEAHVSRWSLRGTATTLRPTRKGTPCAP